MSIQFIDLQAQRRRIGEAMTRAVMDAVEGGQWVMGPQVRQFESDLAAFGQARHALGWANGTDALALPLMAWGVGRGDAVFCPSFTSPPPARWPPGSGPRTSSSTSSTQRNRSGGADCHRNHSLVATCGNYQPPPISERQSRWDYLGSELARHGWPQAQRCPQDSDHPGCAEARRRGSRRWLNSRLNEPKSDLRQRRARVRTVVL